MPAAGSDGRRTCRLSRKSSIPGRCRRRARAWPAGWEWAKSHAAPLTLAQLVIRVVRRLSIRPPLLSICPPVLSICPPVLSIFDARLVADAGGEKRASRSGSFSYKERPTLDLLLQNPIAGFWGAGWVPSLPVDPPAAPVDSPVDPPAAPVDSPVDPVDVRRVSRGRRRRRKTCKPQRLPK